MFELCILRLSARKFSPKFQAATIPKLAGRKVTLKEESLLDETKALLSSII